MHLGSATGGTAGGRKTSSVQAGRLYRRSEIFFVFQRFQKRLTCR
ncbi:MAG: hypothetical protein WD491_09270 [Balneolales bacterium]